MIRADIIYGCLLIGIYISLIIIILYHVGLNLFLRGCFAAIDEGIEISDSPFVLTLLAARRARSGRGIFD